MTREEAIKYIKSRCIGSTEERDGTQWSEAMWTAIEALADRPTTDCTKFMEWLKAEALDEENWELNAVANGEVICRKFRKLGWLDVEDGYYVDTRPTVDKEYLIDLIQEAVHDGEACAKLIDLVDRPTGEWIKSDILPNGWHCSHCDAPVMTDDIDEMLFCPNCGAKMRGETE